MNKKSKLTILLVRDECSWMTSKNANISTFGRLPNISISILINLCWFGLSYPTKWTDDVALKNFLKKKKKHQKNTKKMKQKKTNHKNILAQK